MIQRVILTIPGGLEAIRKSRSEGLVVFTLSSISIGSSPLADFD